MLETGHASLRCPDAAPHGVAGTGANYTKSPVDPVGEQSAGLGQEHAIAASVEQGDAQILFDFGDEVLVKIIPDMYDIILGTVQMNHVYGAVLIEIKQDLMPKWQRLIKRLIDVTASAVFLILLSPL